MKKYEQRMQKKVCSQKECDALNKKKNTINESDPQKNFTVIFDRDFCSADQILLAVKSFCVSHSFHFSSKKERKNKI